MCRLERKKEKKEKKNFHVGLDSVVVVVAML